MTLCKCGHEVEHHYYQTGECNASDCGCARYKPVEVDA